MLGKTSKVSKIFEKFKSKLIFEKWLPNFFFEFYFFEKKLFENIFENFEKSLTLMEIEFCKEKSHFFNLKFYNNFSQPLLFRFFNFVKLNQTVPKFCQK